MGLPFATYCQLGALEMEKDMEKEKGKKKEEG